MKRTGQSRTRIFNRRRQSKQSSCRIKIKSLIPSYIPYDLQRLCSLCSLLLFFRVGAQAAPPTFEKDIRPILKAHCFDCHGEGEKLNGGLDLRLQRLMLKGGEDGPVIVPGKPDRSLLFKLVHSGEMPKRDKKLTREQVALIKQ